MRRLEHLRNLVGTTVARCGRIDVVVNNPAANARGTLDTLDPQAIAAVIDTNLKAPLLLTRFALPHLRESGGVVVNVASIAGHVGLPHEAPYCASMWGLRGFTFAVRDELRDDGVAVCVVSPGPISTPFVLDDLDHVPDLVFSQPILTAGEVAEAILACAIDRKRERAFKFVTQRGRSGQTSGRRSRKDVGSVEVEADPELHGAACELQMPAEVRELLDLGGKYR